MEASIEKAAKLLGYNLKVEQRSVIWSFVMGQDMFAVLLTGFGKSWYRRFCPAYHSSKLGSPTQAI